VTLQDTNAPTLLLPGNMVVEQTSTAGAVVNYPVTATDEDGPVTLSCNLPTGSLFAPGTTSVSCSASDNGQSTSGSFTITVKDTTAPTITVAGVRDLGVYRLNGVGTPTYTVTDSGSGVAASTASLTAPSSASGAGVYTFTITATDKAGNSRMVTVTYFVLYNFSGFERPLTEGGSYILGKNIPVKFRLTDAKRNLITNAVAKLTVDGLAALSGGADAGNTFTWDGTQYIFTLKTSGLAAGDHLIQVMLDDGTVEELLINLSSGGVNVENGTLYDSSATVVAGQWLTLAGGGFKAGATVTVDLGVQLIKTATANSYGVIVVAIQIPTTDPSGTWVITATGTAADGGLLVDSVIVTVVPP
jgi:hypothetical protein